MNKTSLIASSFLFVGVSFILLNCSNVDNNKMDYLQKVLNNLNRLNPQPIMKQQKPGHQVIPLLPVFINHYIKEFDNPSDTTIGASYVRLLQEDTTQMTFCYDGKMRAVVYEEDKMIGIDSFLVRSLPFRPLTPPFFNYTKSIIKYALETKDSILTEFEDFGETLFFRLTIFEDHQVEFFGKAYYMEINPYDFGETTSKYELWIDKSTDLPYRCQEGNVA